MKCKLHRIDKIPTFLLIYINEFNLNTVKYFIHPSLKPIQKKRGNLSHKVAFYSKFCACLTVFYPILKKLMEIICLLKILIAIAVAFSEQRLILNNTC